MHEPNLLHTLIDMREGQVGYMAITCTRPAGGEQKQARAAKNSESCQPGLSSPFASMIAMADLRRCKPIATQHARGPAAHWMGQRTVLGRHDAGAGGSIGNEVLMAEHGALGHPGGAAGVAQGGRVVGLRRIVGGGVGPPQGCNGLQGHDPARQPLRACRLLLAGLQAVHDLQGQAAVGGASVLQACQQEALPAVMGCMAQPGRQSMLMSTHVGCGCCRKQLCASLLTTAHNTKQHELEKMRQHSKVSPAMAKVETQMIV